VRRSKSVFGMGFFAEFTLSKANVLRMTERRAPQMTRNGELPLAVARGFSGKTLKARTEP